MPHILVNTLYYCKRKKLMNSYLVPRAANFLADLVFWLYYIVSQLPCYSSSSRFQNLWHKAVHYWKKIRLTKIKLTCFNFCYSLPYFNTFHCILKNRLRLTADVFQTDAKSLVDSVVELILIFYTYGVSFIRVIKGTNLQGLTPHYMYCMLILTKRILHSVSKLIPRERSYSNQTFEVQEVIQTLPMRNQNTK